MSLGPRSMARSRSRKTARHAAAVMRNFDFFGAPLAGIACIDRDHREGSFGSFHDHLGCRRRSWSAGEPITEMPARQRLPT
jgi:hypothetical protein